MTTLLIEHQLALHSLQTGRESRIVSALTMLKQLLFKHQGHIGAALILGGVDIEGPQLYTIAPHGSTDKLPYVTMGSGSLAAMAVFESEWRKDMTREQAIELVANGISAGIFNDLGSGSNIDVTILSRPTLTPEQAAQLPANAPKIAPVQVEYLRNYKTPNVRGPKERSYKYPTGTNVVLTSDFKSLVNVEDEVFIPSGAVPQQDLPVPMEVE